MAVTVLHPGLSELKGAQLQSLNTFGVRATAARLFTLTAEDALDALRKTVAGTYPKILGGGSNLVIQQDLTMPVIQVALKGIRLVEQLGNSVTIEAAAGEPWHPFVRHCLDNGWFGLENLSLIPGNVGTCPIQNIGAYGKEVAQSITSLRAYHLISGETKTWSNQDCQFAYRNSAFKHGDGANWIILSVRFLLTLVPQPQFHYADLKAYLTAADLTNPTPLQISDAVCAIRSKKLPDPKHIGNAGSFFKNPLVASSLALHLKTEHPNMPIYDQADAAVKKLSAGWLIDQCGWKGKRVADAGVHKEHALVLVNYGQATGAEILALAAQIQTSVQNRFGIALQPEPIVW